MKKEYLYKQIMKSSSNAGTTFLYAGSDHLLLVDRTLLYEKYRKFFYADIQAFSIKKSPESTIFTCLLLLIFIPFLIFSFYEPTVFYISGFYGFLLCINFAMGQSCKAYIHTGVQVERLTMLNRKPKFKKFMESELIRIIEEYQHREFARQREHAGNARQTEGV